MSQGLTKSKLSERSLSLGRRKKLINNSTIPQYKIEAIDRCILPDILAFYESEEGQREFAEWKRQQEYSKDAFSVAATEISDL